jgi:hypothetical protein
MRLSRPGAIGGIYGMSAGKQGLVVGWRGRLLALLGASALALAISLAATTARAGASVPEKTDIMFIFDTSGSMQSVLQEAKEEIKALIANTETSLPNAEFGVANVEDLPNYDDGTLNPAFNEKGEEVATLSEKEYEEDAEKPWRLDQALTNEQAKVEEAIDNLSEGAGGDLPEAYGRALYETATNPRVKWRPGARHEIVMIADNVPHTPNVNEGIPSEFQFTEPLNDDFATWPDTGEELSGKWGIPGTVWKEGESLEFHKTLQKLDSEAKPLAMVDYFHTEESEKSNYIHYWEYWAADTGGQAITAEEGTKSLDARLAEIIKESAEGIPPCPPGFERTETTPCVKKPTTTSSSSSSSSSPPPPPPPPPPPAPDSSFTVGSIHANPNGTVTIVFVPTQSGSATLTVTVPTASIARTEAAAAKSRKCKKSQIKLKGKCLPKTTVSGTVSASGAAGVPLTLTVKPSGKVLAALKKGKTVVLTATLTYKSALGGSPFVKVLQLTVKPKSKHHH